MNTLKGKGSQGNGRVIRKCFKGTGRVVVTRLHPRRTFSLPSRNEDETQSSDSRRNESRINASFKDEIHCSSDSLVDETYDQTSR